MRCLYCGKHLPLLRKLTGGGEFCSEAHKESYHEEYNQLALSRLLQAQTRPEEPKAVAEFAEVAEVPEFSEAVEPEPETAAVAVADEPEMEELVASCANEFSTIAIAPAVAQREVEIEVAPVFDIQRELARPSMQNGSCSPRREAGFLAIRPAFRQVPIDSLEMAPPSEYEGGQILPLSPAVQFADGYLRGGGAVPLGTPSAPKNAFEPLELGVNEIDFAEPGPVLPILIATLSELVLPNRTSRPFEVASLAPDGPGEIEISVLQSFPDLMKQKPIFEVRVTLLDMSESDSVEGEPAEVIPITPRRVLAALAQMQRDRKETNEEPPPRSRSIKTIVNPVAASSPEVLATGFDSILFEAKPRLLRFTTQPLRPKMAIGTAAGPLSARTSEPKTTTVRKAQPQEPKNGNSRITTRSMLHLEDEDRTSETDTEAPTLFGKLGGLFGKKSRAVKQ